ncbi:MAG: molybdopterin molybdotransferase MoeA [Anaerolineales bacterium]|jgi:molybdopterin molybdotransferase
MMISVTEALERILESVDKLSPKTILIETALGNVLAAPVFADRDFPAFDNSSMDGIAVIAGDSHTASHEAPVKLALSGSIPAGDYLNQEVGHNQAVQIMTGAPLPPGADAVIPVENTSLDFSRPVTEDFVLVYQPAKEGDNIRMQGEFYKKGEQLIPAGHCLRPQDIALLATIGKPEISVVRTPRVGVLTTGDELVPPGEPLAPGKIRDSNSYMLAALLKQAGMEVIHTGIVSDEREKIIEALNLLVRGQINLILTSGGVSMGAYDLIRQVLESEGELKLWKVNMRPGKPLAFGDYRGTPFIGLPGNPVSAFVGFQVFVYPTLRKMKGLPAEEIRVEEAVLLEDMRSDGRESYIPAHLEKHGETWVVQPAANQSSGNLYALVPGNSLIIVPVGVKFLNKDQIVNVRRLD